MPIEKQKEKSIIDAVVKTPEFLPFTSVGIFRFGADITQHKKHTGNFMYELLMSLEQKYYESLPDSKSLLHFRQKTKLFRYFVIRSYILWALI